MIVTQSDTSNDAVQKFDQSMASLRKLDVAQQYMELLTEVENLRFIDHLKVVAEYTHNNILYAALKHAAISKNLLEMLYSHTFGYKNSSML